MINFIKKPKFFLFFNYTKIIKKNNKNIIKLKTRKKN